MSRFTSIYMILLYLVGFGNCNFLRDFYVYHATGVTGTAISLEQFRGKPALVLNVASECGYTDNHYRGLSHLSQMPGIKGNINILLFPCNQFGQQEPGTNAEIERFINNKYPGNYHIFGKIDVVGEDIDPAFEFLIKYSQKTPSWNFWKYLVDHKGHVIDAWGPQISIEDLHQYIIAAIQMANKDEL